MTAATATTTAAVPAHALRRGTRGFAAVVTFLSAMLVLAVSVFVLPSSQIDGRLLTVLVPLGIAFGIAHLVTIYGTLRRRRWAVALSLYVLAIGLGAAAFALLLVATGVNPFLAAGAESTLQARIDTVGLLVWLIGSWIVGTRFVLRGMAGPDRQHPDEDPAPAVGEVESPRIRRLGPRTAVTA